LKRKKKQKENLEREDGLCTPILEMWPETKAHVYALPLEISKMHDRSEYKIETAVHLKNAQGILSVKDPIKWKPHWKGKNTKERTS